LVSIVICILFLLLVLVYVCTLFRKLIVPQRIRLRYPKGVTTLVIPAARTNGAHRSQHSEVT
jgi:uncharacterized oligopeptide transporter (OPT) family protein